MAELRDRDLFPDTAEINDRGHIAIGNCDLTDVVREFGSPLYLFDEVTIRAICRGYLGAFEGEYPKTHVSYAAKAFINPALLGILSEEEIGLEVVSGGELALARAVGYPPTEINFHGNNKSEQELQEAIDFGIARITIDSFTEIELLQKVAARFGISQKVLLRVSPSVDAHTHRLITTGTLDTKFGFSIETGDAEHAVERAMAAQNLDVAGIHFHLGSQIFETAPYAEAIPYVIGFCARMRDRYGLELRELSPGGGFALGYTSGRLPPTISTYAAIISKNVRASCDALGFEEPLMLVEPGRSIVGRAGVAIYTVGAIKEIPGVRTYVSVDGGMGDNIRPALYGAEYEALSVNRPLEPISGGYRIAGKYCESGDVLVDEARLPPPEPGDLIVLPAAGAYCIPMASNYNMAVRPAVVMVLDGDARMIRRRETYDDILTTSMI